MVRNLNRSNPLDLTDFAGLDLTSCPKEDNEDFIHVKVSDLESIQHLLPFMLPTMSVEEFPDILSFTGKGTFTYQ